MSELIRKPYKITLWEDKNKYIINDDIVQNQYLEEICIATIGSNTMDTPIRAFNPILTEELNGSKTFTFQINYRYWDDEDEEFKLNPFINLLVNERKVKLKYDDEWYDFVIKQIDENSESNTFTYTCKDLFINELGKTGYEVELDTELRNNMGTITELANSILKGTDWQVDEDNCDPLIQRNKEGLYSFVVPDDSQDINCTPILGGEPVTISSGQVILVFYSCKANKENPVQFLYKDQSIPSSTADEAIANFYKTDEYGFVVDADNYELTCSELGISDLDDFYNSLTSSSYFGQKIIKKQEMHYLPQIDETCTVWTKNNNRYYCYKELEYASVAQVQNMLSNSSGFISTNGWVGQVGLSTVTIDGVVQRAIDLNSSTYNTGFYDNRQLLSPKGFVNGEKYIVAVRGTGSLGTSTLKLVDKTNPNTETPVLTFNQTTGFTKPTELSEYTVRMATCSSTINYSTIINNYGDIRFYLGYSGNLIDCKVFKYRVDSTGKMIVPDLEQYANTIIQTRYNFFLESSIPNNAIYTKQDLTITESLLDTTTGYEPVMIDGCKKVTSITGSKSNRFNLIQSLCEAFECWAKFTIEHDEQGRIKYQYNKINSNSIQAGKRYYTWIGRGDAPSSNSNDSNFKIITDDMQPVPSSYYEKIYSKYVSFKEYIGDDNPVGFRYGINLSSIQRNIISDQIASKVIVQANSNEFAPNGSCTIQQSVLNPTGENALYNFQYFINHGLLDATSLYDDLYGTNGGLGFYTKMKQYNDSIQPKIQELSEISKSLYTLNSRQTVYDALIEEANRLYEDASLELSSAGYSSTGTAPTYITELRNEMSSYQSTISYYSNLSSRNKTLLDAYTAKYNQISGDLASVRALKDKLNQDFANKYYRFIQEGTWNSEDYWDPELYYQAANMVLYTSSFPQISYSINVLEISEIEGFEAYKFKIADKTYIEDTEFFGYDSKGRPYKEEIVVSQVTRHLDDNSQNTITVQNYKTQFQDLFQRIAAASQSLQYHEGAYRRAASAINSDGTINSALLQNSLEANALVIQNANNQSVVWDETGITISNFVNANEIVRLTSRGIVLSSNGGKDWTTGITGDGINADVITAGRIDTDRIRIFNKAMQQTFEWNSTGINAYMQGGSFIDNGTTIGLEANQVNYGKFVRFDQYGLYGYAGGDPTWSPGESGITKVIEDSIFSLTWKGLSINIPNYQDESVIAIGPTNNRTFEITGNGNIIMRGSITLGGNITWSNNSTPVKALYAAPSNNAAPTAPTAAYDSNTYDDSSTTWHKVFNSASDEYISYSYTGGTANSWTAPAKYVAKDGQAGTVDGDSVYNAIVSGTGTGGKFGLFSTDDGKLILSATAGKIGGWTIANNSLYTGSGTSYVGINSSTSSSVSNYTYAFWAGNATPGSAPFSVKKNGTLVCSSATVTGTIKASSLQIKREGTYTNILQAVDANSDSLKGSYIDAKGITVTNNSSVETFKVEDNGNVTVKGTIYANNVYSMSDSSNYINVGSDGIKIYTNSKLKATLGSTNTSYNSGGDSSMMIKLGSTSPLYIEKVYVSGRNQVWIGNSDMSCGIGFNFSANPPIYQIKGTAGTISW